LKILNSQSASLLYPEKVKKYFKKVKKQNFEFCKAFANR
jgi:hypothetical protein